MKKCEKCSNELSEDAKFCGKCGKSVSSENTNKNDNPNPITENKKQLTVSKIFKNILELIPVTLLIISYGVVASYNSTANNVIVDIFNIVYFLTIIALLSNWWKNRKTNKKWFTKRFKIFIIILSLAGFVVVISSQALILAREKAGFSAESLQKIADNRNKDLPIMIDDETRFDSVTGGENRFTYKYTLINYTFSGTDGSDLNNDLRTDLVKSVCTAPEMALLIRNKIILNFTYYDKNGLLITNIPINTGVDCK